MTTPPVWHLENFDLLEPLSSSEKEFLGDQMSHKSYQKGDAIYFPGDTSQTVYFLKEGKVKISSTSSEGKEMILGSFRPGEVFRELAMAGQTERDHIAEAIDNATVCAITAPDFENVLAQIPKLNLRLTKLIGLRLRKIESRLQSLVFKNAPERIKHFIKDMALEYGRDVGTEKEVR